MALPHFRNSEASRNSYEVLNPSQFEALIIPPSGAIPSGGNAQILTEHVLSVEGLFSEPTEGSIQQKFQTTTRNYDTNDGDTSIEFTINFSLNLNDASQNYVAKILRNWKRLQRNPLTGARGLKKNYIGTIRVVKFNRDGTIFWTRTAKYCFITSNLPDLTNDYGSSEPQTLSVTFRADVFEESEL